MLKGALTVHWIFSLMHGVISVIKRLAGQTNSERLKLQAICLQAADRGRINLAGSWAGTWGGRTYPLSLRHRPLFSAVTARPRHRAGLRRSATLSLPKNISFLNSPLFFNFDSDSIALCVKSVQLYVFDRYHIISCHWNSATLCMT